MNNKFDEEFDVMKTKAHYSKEVLYKLLAPTIFPQYEQIIITDVDVVFCGDIAEIYDEGQFDEFIAGIAYHNVLENFMRNTYEARFKRRKNAL